MRLEDAVQAGSLPGLRTSNVGGMFAGPSVQITDRVAALARPAEILVSRTVKDLVTGASIAFAERGSHMLNGPPDEWPLFAVTGLGSPGDPALQVGPDAGDAAVQVVQ